ncbi:hypothetical protein PR001_g19680 [Phytophthora rubi]|uniref:Uncharacterized protein n=2 Tax=Phytophthora rubi TaxID=129364 RepID=A0A6A3JZ86_9STRA|nr:hypothetical protein PR001_g19680 [Phytophthora rubi]
MDAASSATIVHACSISPLFKSRRKCFHERSGGRVISAASHGGPATSTLHSRGGSSTLFPTRSEITSDSVSSGSCYGARGRRVLRRSRRRTGRGVSSTADGENPCSITSRLGVPELNIGTKTRSKLFGRVDFFGELLLDHPREPMLDRKWEVTLNHIIIFFGGEPLLIRTWEPKLDHVVICFFGGEPLHVRTWEPMLGD